MIKQALLALSLLLPASGALAQNVSTSTQTKSTTALSANLTQTGPIGAFGFEVTADSTLYAGLWYILIFNTSTDPSDGAVTPTKCYVGLANSPTIAGGFTASSAFNSGITIAVSTTGCFTKTESTHAFISLDYKAP